MDKAPKPSFIDTLKVILTFPTQVKNLAEGYQELYREHTDLLKQYTELLERNTSFMQEYMKLRDGSEFLAGRYEELRNNYKDLLKLQKPSQPTEGEIPAS